MRKVMMMDPAQWTQEMLEQHSVDMRQFIDFRQATLADGGRIIEAYNAAGLRFTLLPDRGLDIWRADYRGLPLTWISQGSPQAPDFGRRWLEQMNGGLLVTCGLTHVGPPEVDAVTGEWRDIHGRYSRLRANDLQITRGWYDDGRYAVTVKATIYETALHGDQLKLERTLTMPLAQPEIHIADTVTNMGDTATPLMILYHLNPGFPLIGEGARLHVPAAQSYARDNAARAGFDRWPDYDAATPQYPEQVFYHHVNATDGQSRVVMARDELGLQIDWRATELPYLVQWKNTRQGMYVCGIEPGNCIPEGLNAARDHGRLQILEPGAALSFALTLRVLDGAESITASLDDVETLRQSGTPVDGCILDDYA